MSQVIENQYILGQSAPGTVTPGGEANIDLTLQPSTSNPTPPTPPVPPLQSASIEGTVTSNGAPVSGAYVKLMSLSYVPIMHAITNASGEYVLTNVPAGSYYLFSIAPGKQLSQLGPIEATNGTELTENFNLIADNTASLGVISGNISSSTGPVANAVLTLTQQGSPNTVVAVTYTNSQGNYAFTEVSPGTYNINVSAPGYISASGSATVTAGQIATLNEVLTASSGMAGGTVSGVITDNTGAAVVGANVILYSENTQTKALTPIQFTTSGPNGVYLFIGVGQGTYVIKANKNA